MKFYSLLLFSTLLSTGIIAQDAAMIHFTSEDCGFTALLPEKPAIRQDSVFAQDQVIYSTEYLSTSQSKVMYSITCGDFPVARMLDSTRKIMNTLRAGTAPKVGGEIQNVEEFEIDGNYGLSYIEKSDMFTVYNQILLVGDNLFQMYVSSLVKDAKDEAEVFYNNFKLK
ncbi:MAG: hypothetical protein RLN81_13805 [Balneolaceae bacterium]